MTDSALVLHYASAQHTAPARRAARADVSADWVLSSAIFAAFIVALMVAIGAFSSADGARGEWTTWASLWFLALLALSGGAHLARRVRRELAHQAADGVARPASGGAHEAAIRVAAQGDPRMLRELQVLRDRAEWRAAER